MALDAKCALQMLHAQTLVVTAVQARHWQEPHGRSRSRGILPNQFILYTTTLTFLLSSLGKLLLPSRTTSVQSRYCSCKAQSRRDLTPVRRSRPPRSCTKCIPRATATSCMHLPTTATPVRQTQTPCQSIYPPLHTCICPLTRLFRNRSSAIGPNA